MDHTGKEAEAVGVLVSCPRGSCRTGCPADIRGYARPTAPGRGGEEASSDPVPDWACCLPAYPSERCLHPRDRQHRFFGTAELVSGPCAAQACWKRGGGSQFWFVFVFLIPVAFALCAGEIGGCFHSRNWRSVRTLGKSGLETSCCLSASGGYCSGHLLWLLSCWLFRGLVVREESRI